MDKDKRFVKYEKLMCKHHSTITGQSTWHWRDVSDNVLVASGWRHNLNRLRHTRIQCKKEGVPVEYGLDGISFDGNTYHGLQAKCWEEKRRICANDIGTFLSVVMNRFQVKNKDSKAYLYTKANLETNLREDIENGGHIETIRLDYPELPDETTTTKKKPAKFQLRNYQVEAVNSLNTALQEGERNGWLSMPCGTGKTSCYGEFGRQFKKVIILSPLRVSAQQNLHRLTHQLGLKKQQTILVDCDHIREEKQVLDFWVDENNKLISTTFKSAETLLQEVLFSKNLSKDVLVIVDEAHNRTDEMRDWMTAKKGDSFMLWVSATPLPAENEQIFFSYSWADALNANWICDYDLLMPIITSNNEEDTDVDTTKMEDDDLLMLKARFLISGMLRLGVRRVISYCYSKSECDKLIEILRKVCCEEMGLVEDDVWLSKITEDVPGKRRDEILNEFQQRDKRIHIITSVRILDEAIDIPACDGVFFLRVTNRRESWIRTIQRMSRANRRDSSNINKKARIFLWLDNANHEKLPKCLEMIRDSDPEFYKKIQCLDVGAYDRKDSDDDLQTYEEKETLKRRSDCSVVCVTLAELKDRKLNICIQYFKKYGKWPPCAYTENGMNIGIFWMCIRIGHTSLSDDQQRLCLELDANCFKRRQFNRVALSMSTSEKIEHCIEYYRKMGRWPPSKLKTTWNVGSFFRSMRYGNVYITDKQRQCLLEIDPTCFTPKEQNLHAKNMGIHERVDALITHFHEYGSYPNVDYVRRDGVRLGKMLSSMKIGHIILSEEQRKRLVALDPDCLTVRETNPEARMNRQEKIQICKEYRQTYSCWPPPNYITDSGYKLGNYWSRLIRSKIKISDAERADLLSIDLNCFNI